MGQCFSILNSLASNLDPQPDAPPRPPPANNSNLPAISHAYVSKMPDGDTLTCTHPDPATGSETSTRVRIYAIDCPETAQNFGSDAKEIGQALLLHKTVTLQPHTIDRYGRLVADVITHTGINYSEYMLRKGAAWHYKAYDKSPHLAALETEARASRVGLWSYARPQPPWDYRRRRRQAKANK